MSTKLYVPPAFKLFFPLCPPPGKYRVSAPLILWRHCSIVTMALAEAARNVAMDTSFPAPDNCPSSAVSDEFKISITSGYKVFFSF